MKKQSSETKQSVVLSPELGLRQRAEAVDREKRETQLQLDFPMSPEEIQKTLHELQVHQIELEMQNDELRRTQSELMETKARYFDLYDLAPVGYLTVSNGGIILEANLTAGTLFGVDRRALVNKRISKYIFRDDQDTYYRHKKALFESGDPQNCDIRVMKNDIPCWVHLSATTQMDSNGSPTCRVVISDISVLKQAENALSESRERYMALFEYSGLGIGYYSPEGVVISYNRKALENMGGQPDDYIGKSFAMIFPQKRSGSLYATVKKSSFEQ